MSWTHPRDYAISLNDALAANDDLLGDGSDYGVTGEWWGYEEISPGAAIAQRYAPFIGKAIVVGLFVLVAGLCAVHGGQW